LIAEEHHHGHGHGTGVRWLDIIVGVSAFLISIVSLVVSFEHGHTMRELVTQNEKLVAANTIPLLDFSSSNLEDETNKPYFKLTVRNGGVGPAVIDWFELRYKDVPYGTSADLLDACCSEALKKNAPKSGSVWYSKITNNILPARDSFDPMIVRSDAGDDLIKAINHARPDITARACYCSVLDECWLTNFDSNRPTKVERCDPLPHEATW
jgi:hypothetical protein